MLTHNAFRLILFDLGGVIFPFNLRIATTQFEKYSRLSSEEIIRAIMGTSLDWAFEKGEISPEAFYEEVKKRIGLTLSYDLFVAIWNDIFSEDKTVSDLIRRLKKQYLVAILSNTNVLHFDFIYKRFSIVQEVGHFILSYEVGVRKPNPKIFQIALDRFKVAPQRTLYIDDREDLVVASRALGFYGIHFRGIGPLEAELRALKVLTE